MFFGLLCYIVASAICVDAIYTIWRYKRYMFPFLVESIICIASIISSLVQEDDNGILCNHFPSLSVAGVYAAEMLLYGLLVSFIIYNVPFFYMVFRYSVYTIINLDNASRFSETEKVLQKCLFGPDPFKKMDNHRKMLHFLYCLKHQEHAIDVPTDILKMIYSNVCS